MLSIKWTVLIIWFKFQFPVLIYDVNTYKLNIACDEGQQLTAEIINKVHWRQTKLSFQNDFAPSKLASLSALFPLKARLPKGEHLLRSLLPFPICTACKMKRGQFFQHNLNVFFKQKREIAMYSAGKFGWNLPLSPSLVWLSKYANLLWVADFGRTRLSFLD